MDKDFVKDNNLNEAVKRFNEIAGYKSPRQSLNEFTFITRSQVDEEEDAQQQPNDGLQSPQGNEQQQQGDTQQPPQQDMQNQGVENNVNMGQGGNIDGNDDMNQQPNDNNMPMDDGGQMPDMGNIGIPDEEDGIETEEMEPGDEVIDVDELTQAQEETDTKIDGVDERLSDIFSVVKDFSEKLEKQEQSIMNLKTEFEKRNPTQTEKFNLRSQAGGPYNQTPTEYWDNLVQQRPNYEVISDNDVSTADEDSKYKITKSDISGLNMKNISDTLDIRESLSDYITF